MWLTIVRLAHGGRLIGRGDVVHSFLEVLLRWNQRHLGIVVVGPIELWLVVNGDVGWKRGETKRKNYEFRIVLNCGSIYCIGLQTNHFCIFFS